MGSRLFRNGSFAVIVPRDDIDLESEMGQIPASAGIASRFYFFRCPCGKVKLLGDFLACDYERDDVLDALRAGKFEVVSMSPILENTRPSLVSIRFQAEGEGEDLVKTLRHALDAVGAASHGDRAGRLNMNRRTIIFILGAILLAWTAAVFLPARHFDFVNWDDYDEVTENPLLHPPTTEHLGQIWSGPYLKMYAPLSYSASWVIVQFRGAADNPAVFHALNIALHLASVALVFSILLVCVKSPMAAFGGAAIFALHPVQVESVAWVSEMNNLLAAACRWPRSGCIWRFVWRRRMADGGILGWVRRCIFWRCSPRRRRLSHR